MVSANSWPGELRVPHLGRPPTPIQLLHACGAVQGQLEGAKCIGLPIRKLENFGDPRLRDFGTGTGCNPCVQSSSLGLGVTSGGETGLLPVSILAATDGSFANGIGLLSVADGRTLPVHC